MFKALRQWLSGTIHLRQERTTAMRLLATVSSASALPLWYVAAQQQLFDPLLPRAGYVALALGWTLASYLWPRVAHHAHIAGALLLPYVTVHLFALAAVNSLEPFYQTGLVLVAGITAALGPSLNLRPPVLFGYYVCCMVLAVAVVASQSPAIIEARASEFLITVLVICLLSMVVVRMNGKMSSRLLAAEQKLQQTIDAAPIAIITFDRSGVCTFAQGRGLNALGVDTETMVGKTVETTFAVAPRFAEIYVDISKGMVFSGVINHEAAAFDIWWGQGDEGTVMVASDISRRQRLEQALVRTETRLWATFEALRDSIVSIDLEGEIFETRCHGALLAGGGLKKTPDLLRRICVELRKALEQAEPQTFEHTLMQPERLDFEVRVVPAGAHEGVALIRDITDQRRMQERILVSDRMASLGTLAAGVAHEINNPLSYLFGNLTYLSELLIELPAGSTNKDFERALADASDGAARIREIVGDLQAFASPGEENNDRAELSAVLQRAVALTRAEIHHRAQLHRDITSPIWVQGDAGRLGQLFLNLLVNAAHAVKPGAPHDNSISVSCQRDGDSVVVEIIDTGDGMDRETQRRVFDPFFTTKAVGQGTGLGLFVCHRIAESVGGRISIDSSPGKGTAMRVKLVASEAPLVGLQSIGAPAESPSLKVMVVDDDPAVTRLLVRCLRRHHVTVASNGEEALEKLNTCDFQIILCDLMMPGLGGPGFYSKAIELRPELRDHFGFMTAGVFTEDAENFLAEINPPVLNKPFDPKGLERWLEKLARPGPDLRLVGGTTFQPQGSPP